MAEKDFFGHNYAAWTQAMRESYGSPKPYYVRQSWPNQTYGFQGPVVRQPYSMEPTARPVWINHTPAIKAGSEMLNQKVAESHSGPMNPQTAQGDNVNWTRKPHMAHNRPAKVAVAPANGNANPAMYTYGNTWAQGLCECTDDAAICLCVACCTPCAACQVARDMDEFVCLPACTMCPCPSFTPCLLGHPCPWFYAARSRVRAQLALEGSMCDDCLVASFCYPCGLCQLMREVKLAKEAGKI